MTGAETLRSRRYLALMAFGAVFCAYGLVFCLVITVTGGLPDHSLPRLLGVVALMVLLLAAAAACAMALRSRVVMREDGLEIVGAFQRARLPWERISDMTLRRRYRSWDVAVRTPDTEHIVLIVPVGLVNGGPAERYTTAPPHTPRRVRERYERLRGRWERAAA